MAKRVHLLLAMLMVLLLANVFMLQSNFTSSDAEADCAIKAPRPPDRITLPLAEALVVSNNSSRSPIQTGETFVRKRFSNSEMMEIFGRTVPGKRSEYFNKHSDLDASLAHANEVSGLGKPTRQIIGMGGFPGRMFAILDMVEWNQTYGFLNCRKLLALNEDPENTFVNAEEGIQLYVYKKSQSHWGDIHWPLEVSTTGGYDLVLFGQTFEHLYDPVLCFKQLYDAMAPGGFMFTSGPHLNHLHMEPIFFSMPTPWGLALWAEMAGFTTLKVGMFGNDEYLENVLIKYKTWWKKTGNYYNKTRRPQIPNDSGAPGQVWILVQKPV